MNKLKLTSWILGIALLATVVGCKKDFDAPPGHTLETGDIITIGDLFTMFAEQGSTTFTEDKSIFGVITADEATGNFYHEFHIQDEETGMALHVNLVDPGGVTIGDRVRINLNNTILTELNGLLSLDEVDITENVFIQENLINIEPITITLDDNLNDYVSRLVRIEGVQLSSDASCASFANGQSDPPASFNRIVMDCNGNTIIMRNSGFANFADVVMPGGNGTFIGILSKYNDDWQLKVRMPSELDMNGPRCGGEPTIDCSSFFLTKNFEDEDINSGGWTTYVSEGSANWEASFFSGANFARISNYDGTTNNPTQAWLISPAVDLSGAGAPFLNFSSAVGWDGDVMEVYVSTDYTSGDPNAATWTALPATLPTTAGDWYDWTDSGNLDLSSHLSSNTRVAFKYIGGSGDGSTWEVDDILITE